MSLDPTIMESKLSNNRFIVNVIEGLCRRTLWVHPHWSLNASVGTNVVFDQTPAVNGCTEVEITNQYSVPLKSSGGVCVRVSDMHTNILDTHAT